MYIITEGPGMFVFRNLLLLFPFFLRFETGSHIAQAVLEITMQVGLELLMPLLLYPVYLDYRQVPPLLAGLLFKTILVAWCLKAFPVAGLVWGRPMGLWTLVCSHKISDD